MLGSRGILLKDKQIAQLGRACNCYFGLIMRILVELSPLDPRWVLCDVRHAV